ncbi:TetR/AcrR family transcriptional regulator [Haloechinothrix halophila]|uniref:TetR/AcrR family transcriptional regulator n=1 Tax=Haloechinothrix halophila TaxID=1069073 RepID=UPI00068611AC|nr:TetR/AcrR family transcriptional regulator [Haloechinothrix halophila]
MTGRPERSRPTREETRRRVLSAAHDVFTTRGIEAASVADVAAAAGLTKGAVYSSFRSKNDLVLALMDEYVAERQREATALFDSAADADHALRDVGKHLVDAIHTGARWQRLLIAYAVSGQRDPELADALRTRRQRLRESLAAMIERVAERHGLTLPFPPDEAATVVLALSNGFAVEDSLDPGAVPDDLFGRVLAVLGTAGGATPGDTAMP